LTLDPVDKLVCSIENDVIHIYDPRVLSTPENPLNHQFAGFAVPNTAELFLLSFRIRLNNEGFDEANARASGSTGGALPSGASNAKLVPETLRNIVARDLFLREAEQVHMVIVVLVPSFRVSSQRKVGTNQGKSSIEWSSEVRRHVSSGEFSTYAITPGRVAQV
jgi:hypothetical protein